MWASPLRGRSVAGGLIKEFAGISDPYESPDSAEIVLDTRD